MSSFYYTDTEAFTIAHAKHIGSKPATDLLPIQSLFGGVPGTATIEAFHPRGG
jgi:hypothetical protein